MFQLKHKCRWKLDKKSYSLNCSPQFLNKNIISYMYNIHHFTLYIVQDFSGVKASIIYAFFQVGTIEQKMYMLIPALFQTIKCKLENTMSNAH